MADNTFPGAGALGSAGEKAGTEPGLHSSSSADSIPGHEPVVAGDPKLDRIIRWKRDLLLTPVLGLLYTVMFVDRTNIANARIEGLEKGLHMPSDGYNTALWIFYIPFVLAEIPSNLFLSWGKVPPRWFLGGQMFLLGILSMCQGLTRSYGGLLAVRFLMGIFESALPAAATYMLSSYYTKKEASPRFAWFFNFALAGPLFSGVLAYAIENLDGRGGYEGWRWIFIIEGLMAVFFAIVAAVLLPDFPQRPTWFLTEPERHRLLAVLEASRGNEKAGSPADTIPLRKILVDWRIHIFTLIFFCVDVTAGSISGFAPTILTQLGWKATRAQLMTMPVWGAGIVSTFVITFVSNRLNVRFPLMLFATCLQLVGWIIMKVYVPHVGVRYAALFFLSAGTYPQMPLLMGWLSANLRGRRALAVGMAWQVSFGNCANFVSSNVFIKAQSPRYHTGFANGLSFACVSFALICLATALCVRANRLRDARRATMGDEERERDDEVNFKLHI